MSPDADRAPYNKRLYPRSYRKTWDPDDSSWFVWQEVAILMKKEASRKAHLMHCVSLFSDALFKFLLPAPEVHM